MAQVCGKKAYLGLELLVLVLLGGLVIGYLLLGLITGFPDTLGADCRDRWLLGVFV